MATDSQPTSWFRRAPELALALAVAGTAALLVAPIPAAALDGLLAANLAAAVVVVLVALSVRRPLAVSAFPAILLLATLFRLGLNVSSTRLILRDAYAGDVIAAFASWIIGGSLVVGVVIFLILSVIQFVVIARGSERVAEVAARFALDAMPGRQMAIDADLRAGTLDAESAAEARDTLQREGRLYGAMDGAMKFVKGDAIAGLFILTVDIVGGVAVGVLERDLGVLEALQVYGTLTIGDGLVTQIPSLLLAMGAAFVVTRVASVSEHGAASWLGGDIVRQLGAHPRPLAVAAALLFVFALLPGLPAVPFAALGLALVGAATWRWRNPIERTDLRDDARPANALPARCAVTLHEPNDALGPKLIAAWDVERDALALPLPPLTIDPLPSDGDVVLRFDGWTVTTFSRESLETAQVVDALTSRAEHLLAIDDVARMLADWRVREPALVDALTPNHVSVAALTLLFRALLRQGVEPRPMRPLLEALVTGPADGEHDRDTLLEQRVRIARLAIAPRLVADAMVPEARPLVVIGQRIDQMLCDQLRRNPDRPAVSASFQAQVRTCIEPVLDAAVEPPAFAVSTAARPGLRIVLGEPSTVFTLDELAAAERAGIRFQTIVDVDID